MTSVYDWIDPFAEIQRLREEIPRAEQRGEQRGEQRMGDAVGRYHGHELARYADQRAREIMREIVDQSVAPICRELGESMSCYAMADRLAAQIGHFASRSTSLSAFIDRDGEVDFEGHVNYANQMVNDYRRKADEILQLAATKAGWI